jgi:hypothetical protein
MTTIAWISAAGGDWSNGANWQGGVVPGPSDDAILTLGNAETISISSVLQVHSVAFDDPAATYNVTASGALTAAIDLLFQGTDANIRGTLVANSGSISLTMSGTIDVTTGSMQAEDIILNAGGTVTGPVSCFASGTHIATPRGGVPIEELIVGDDVNAHFSDSGRATVQWIGHRHVDCRQHPEPRRVWPVRVNGGAFGAAPCRDLWLSPDHAVLVGDVLIPIKHLVNGNTIEQIPVNEVTYYHIELPRHDVLLAEGLPAESYLDTGDRSNFAHGDKPIRLFPDFSTRSVDTSALWETRGCAPLIQCGSKLDAARRLVNSLASPMIPRSARREANFV